MEKFSTKNSKLVGCTNLDLKAIVEILGLIKAASWDVGSIHKMDVVKAINKLRKLLWMDRTRYLAG